MNTAWSTRLQNIKVFAWVWLDRNKKQANKQKQQTNKQKAVSSFCAPWTVTPTDSLSAKARRNEASAILLDPIQLLVQRRFSIKGKHGKNHFWNYRPIRYLVKVVKSYQPLWITSWGNEEKLSSVYIRAYDGLFGMHRRVKTFTKWRRGILRTGKWVVSKLHIWD